jgi:hypothetical protein
LSVQEEDLAGPGEQGKGRVKTEKDAVVAGPGSLPSPASLKPVPPLRPPPR